MREHTFHKILENIFHESTKSDWKTIAAGETHKKNPLEYLSWDGKDKILFLPYYDAKDVAHLPLPNPFTLPAAGNYPATARAWSNLPAVTVSDELAANSAALDHLSSGADGVLFDCTHFRHPDFLKLLREIQWPHCTLAFTAHHTDADFAHALAAFISGNFDPRLVKGALFWESIPKSTKVDFFARSNTGFKGLGLVIPEAAPASEISEALFKGVQTLEAVSAESASRDVFRSVCFSISADASLPESIAKLRALRTLWFQVARAYGHHDYKKRDLLIHARSGRVEDGAYGPQENMLKGTVAAIAAIMGGCDLLTVDCEEQPSFLPRQARNISTILREESFFDQSPDPAAGAYAIDAITDAIAKKAWAMFQEKCRRL